MAIVYRHRRNDTDTIFYIGISVNNGTKRPNTKTNRSKFWENIYNKTDITVEIISKGIDYETAKELEILLIQEYGRKDLGLGELVNLTDGGDGAVGAIISNETRIKLRKRNLGKVLSIEHKKKISDSHIGKPKSREHAMKCGLANLGKKHPNKVGDTLIDTVTGQEFISILNACRYYNIPETTLHRWIKTPRLNKTNLKYKNI